MSDYFVDNVEVMLMNYVETIIIIIFTIITIIITITITIITLACWCRDCQLLDIGSARGVVMTIKIVKRIEMMTM